MELEIQFQFQIKISNITFCFVWNCKMMCPVSIVGWKTGLLFLGGGSN